MYVGTADWLRVRFPLSFFPVLRDKTFQRFGPGYAVLNRLKRTGTENYKPCTDTGVMPHFGSAVITGNDDSVHVRSHVFHTSSNPKTFWIGSNAVLLSK